MYDLPEELIAQTPLAQRDASRLMVCQGGQIVHRHFADVLEYLRPGDALVINDTRVIPARIYGHREGHEGRVECLLLRRFGDEWETLVKPGKKVRPGARLIFGDGGQLQGEVLSVTDQGGRRIRFSSERPFEQVLDEIGAMPLPPYIHARLADRERYQTVYAHTPGSAAAPTAGLHFTPQLLEQARARGVSVETVLLHVGLGTFRPVKVERVEDHPMHAEYYELQPDTAARLNAVKAAGGRIISVGTTSTRVLETCANDQGRLMPGSGDTDIFIYPGYRFKFIDGLITNFHLPGSTLIMLVSALMGREQALAAYREAVAQRYRFFSFGDAMLIL